MTIAEPVPPVPSTLLSTVVVPIAVIAVIVVMIMPLPPFLLDILISFNITVSVIVLLVSMFISRPVEFSVFPTSLLLLTLYRLALNVSSSRNILLHGDQGTSAAGEVIEAFGSFVVGGNYVIGVVIFLVLIAIQYVVINHGAVRISEVTARFTLDAMPGKQMSIDSDLNAGLIDEAEARRRRHEIARESEFYGAMDGASRFTQRDAIASILITIINIVAGFLIGVLQHGLPLATALETYTVLTIGDGLVTVIPALMISVSGGLVVTRAGSDARLAQDIGAQLFGEPQPLLLAGAVLVALAAFPGLPTVPFLITGGAVGAAGWRIRKQRQRLPVPAAAKTGVSPRDNVESVLRVEPLAVEVGLGLIKLVEGGADSLLLRRISAIRMQLAQELGYVLPPVRVKDNLSLRAREYVVLIKGVEVAKFELRQGCDLAIQAAAPPAGGHPIEGVPTREPAFGIPALWIRSEKSEIARAAGYTVVDAANVLGTHLSEIVKRHAHELFSRQDAKRLLDRVGEENAKVIEDLVPKVLSLALVQKVLQNLLRERVSIRDSVTILEALSEAGNMTRNPLLLTEYVRQSLARAIVQPFLGAGGELQAFFFDPRIEQAVESGVEHSEHSSQLNLPPQRIREIVDRIQASAGQPEGPVVAIASTGARYFLRQLIESSVPNLFVLSHNEVPPGTRVASLGVIQ